jgi:hypothetical protein
MENDGIFYDRLEYFTAIWYNVWPFCIVCGHLLYFPHFDMFGPIKIWQPLHQTHFVNTQLYSILGAIGLQCSLKIHATSDKMKKSSADVMILKSIFCRKI